MPGTNESTASRKALPPRLFWIVAASPPATCSTSPRAAGWLPAGNEGMRESRARDDREADGAEHREAHGGTRLARGVEHARPHARPVGGHRLHSGSRDGRDGKAVTEPDEQVPGNRLPERRVRA